MLRKARVPVRCINAVPPNAPPTAVEASGGLADFEATFVEGVGHFLRLEKPEIFNARLREVLAGLRLR